jgi:hypothetical protein
MRRFVLLATTVAALVASASARADEPAACGDAFDQSQIKRDDGKLVEARSLLRVCGGPGCAPTQQRLCVEWLKDVDARLPSFVPSAKDASGADLVDVKVTMDGVLVAARLDGRAIDADPGLHVFVFQLADGRRVETKAIADERNKGKLVSVTIGQPAPPDLAPPRSPLPASSPATPGWPGPQAARSDDRAVPWRTVGLVVGSAGIVGLGLGTAFGALALSTKSSDCKNGRCEPAGSASTAYSQATISTVGFVAGGILLAGGATMFLLAPKGDREHLAASLTVAPMVGSSAGGLQVAGRW